MSAIIQSVELAKLRAKYLEAHREYLDEYCRIMNQELVDRNLHGDVIRPRTGDIGVIKVAYHSSSSAFPYVYKLYKYKKNGILSERSFLTMLGKAELMGFKEYKEETGE